MQKPSELIHSHQQTGLTTLSKGVILKEQPDSVEVIKVIAHNLNRLGKLYLIPNFSEENAVILAEWVYDNYKFESLETVIECLKNPPETFDEHGNKENNWRLTPDRIQKWMAVKLETVSIQRETEHNKTKQIGIEPLPKVDYESFKQRLAEGTALKEHKPAAWYEDPEYQKFKAERMKAQVLKTGPESEKGIV